MTNVTVTYRARVLVALIRVYQQVASPLFGERCRFFPSCSQYTLLAVERHGILRGVALGLRRLTRCHPWNPGGVDEVPAARDGAPRRSIAAVSEPS